MSLARAGSPPATDHIHPLGRRETVISKGWVVTQFIKARWNKLHFQTERLQFFSHQVLDFVFMIGQAGGLHHLLQEGDLFGAGGFDSGGNLIDVHLGKLLG